MLDQLLDHLEGHGSDMCAHARGGDDMDWMADARGQHLCLPVVVTVNFYDLGQQFQSILSNVVQASEKRADVSCASLGCENGLSSREAERDVDLDSFIRQPLGSFQPITCERAFDDYVRRNPSILAPFAQHTF